MFEFLASLLSVTGGVIVLALVVILVSIAKFAAKHYIKVPPNQVMAKYGRRYRWADGKTRGFKLITGGASLVIPILEKYEMLPLDAFQIKFSVQNVPSDQGVRVTVTAVASLKIGREQEMLESAVSRFLSRNLDAIKSFAQEIMEGGLRGVVATMTVEQLVKERTEFGNRVQEQVSGDLSKLGLVLDNFLIQDISDEQGYIDALGMRQTAQVKRDAAIGEAEALRDKQIRVAEAQRIADEQASAARQAGEIAKAKAEQAISDAERERDVVRAQNMAKVKAEQAKIEIEAQIAAAQKDKDLRVARVAAEQAEVEAQTRLQEKERERRDAELNASLIVEANRRREATVIEANAARDAEVVRATGQKQAIELTAQAARIRAEQEAEATRVTAEKAGQGEQLRLSAEAEGRKAAAAARQAELEAMAKGQQAQLEAEAAGIQAKLEAEAEGILRKAEAFAKLDQAGKLLSILEQLPAIIEATGRAVREAGEGTLAPMAQAIGTGLSGIEEVRIVDLGHGNGAAPGSDALSRYVTTVPDIVFNLAQRAKSLGVEQVLQDAARKLGIDLSVLFEDRPAAADSAPSAAPTAPVSEPSPTAVARPAGSPTGSGHA